MNRNQIFMATLTLGAALVLLISPIRSHGQSEVADAQLDLLIQEIGEQQKRIAENQAAIDVKLATIAEELRIARIFVSRAGGKRE